MPIPELPPDGGPPAHVILHPDGLRGPARHAHGGVGPRPGLGDPAEPGAAGEASRRALRWNQTTLLGAYEKVGKKDPRWDKAAREALEAMAGLFARAADPAPGLDDVYPAAERAVKAGCDDPLVLYAARAPRPSARTTRVRRSTGNGSRPRPSRWRAARTRCSGVRSP